MNKIILTIALVFINSLFAFAQTAASLETILAEAQKQTDNYRETFRNLLADETKTFEDFDKNGKSDGKTSVKSNFLVYQSGKNSRVTTELRNVTEVGGKPIADSQKRAEKFLGELEKTSTLEKELKKISEESSRYDKTWEVYGLTLFQAVALAPNLRPFFDFKLLGTENYQGAEVYVVGFQQLRKTPYNSVNGKEDVSGEMSLNFKLDVPGELKKNDIFLRGKFWIDAKTFQIWREERELTVQASQPLLLLANTFDYQASEYGILVPKNILVTVFNLKKEKDGSTFAPVKDAEIVFAYSKFRQTNVEVKILDEETE